jgi:hypothetical protein
MMPKPAAAPMAPPRPPCRNRQRWRDR